MKLLGYADKLSVAPGELIHFMVSSEAPTYEAAIVRLIHADLAPDGPGFKEEAVPTAVEGSYRGRRQSLRAGSYVRVADHPLLHDLHSLTVQAWIYPTTPQRTEAQGLVTKWSADGVGFGLLLEREGDLSFWIGDTEGRVERLRSGYPVRAAQWYFVACTYDADERRACLYQELLPTWPLDDARIVVERTMETAAPGDVAAPLLIAAGYETTSKTPRAVVGGLYNGKIDSPRLYSRALSPDQIMALKNGVAPQAVAGDGLIAAWDFARDMSLARVTDTSSHELHGRAVNMPARAMTGHNWTGQEVNAMWAPEQYGAMHFHEDDLEDAGWEVDFELTVPADCKSGVYAARLIADEAAEYIPFYVRPARGTARASIAFLAPTMTYLAYANEHVKAKAEQALVSERPFTPEARDVYLADHPELGLSLYDVHLDGSGCCYSSRLRPILDMRPDYRAWHSGAPRHLAADLYLVDWLEAQGYQYDVVTDEDLHLEGRELLAPYRVVITGSHPEYWTTPMLAALEQYLSAGGRLMYMGGNGFYWVTSAAAGRPHVIEVRRGLVGTRAWNSEPGEMYHSTTGELGGLWRLRGKAPQKIAGIGFAAQGWGGATGYRRQPDSFDPRAAFIFEGIGAEETIGDFGLVMGGASGDEIDRLDYALGSPSHTLLLASSTGHTDYYQFVIEDRRSIVPGQGGTTNPLVRSDMTFFETAHGGAVFSVGSINWCGSLSHNNYGNNVSRLTRNVLNRFMT